MDEGSRPTKRSRGLGLVTQNACSECRKKRAKCDGKQPSCSRCETSGVACQYEAPVRVRKDAMRDELQQLHTYRQQSELVLRSLTAEDKAADVLQRLRSGEALESIAARLTTGNIQTERRLVERPAYQTFDPYQAVFGQAAATPSLIDSSGLDTNMSNTIPGGGFEGSNLQYSMGGEMRFEWDAPHESPESSNVSQAGSSVMWSPDNVALSQTDVGARWPIVGSWGEPGRAGGISQRDRGQEFLFAPDPINQPQGLPAFDTTSWTNIKIDSNLMDHLLALYFCWDISKEHFLKDYRSGSQRFCSSLLVNSVLALGCRFSSATQVSGKASDGGASGDVFFAEALRLLSLDKSPSLTTVQALGLMSIREASCGLDSDSWFRSGQSIRMAIQMGLHRVNMDSDDEVGSDLVEVQTATFWGAFALNIAWSMITGRLPHLHDGITFMRKPPTEHRVESVEWVPYTDDGMPLERNCTQPSNIRTIYKCFCELSEILHHSLYAMYSPGNHLTAGRLVGIYTSFLNWYGTLPEALRLGVNFTPAVLFVHMYYHTVVLHLFRPFIKTSFIGSTVSPRDVCIQAADNISSLTRSYSQLYTLRRTPSFVPYIILSSTLTYLITQSPNTSNESTSSLNEKLIQGITDLRHMTVCHGFSRTALRILRFLSQKWNLKGMEDIWSEGEDVGDGEDGVAFSLSSMNHFCPDMQRYYEGSGDMSSDFPLFTVFPMTGLPLVQGDEMEKAGFEMLRQVPAEWEGVG